jgi:hypothetical protein
MSEGGKRMKKVILALAAIMLCAPALWAETRESVFGVTMTVPSGWQALERGAMKDSNMVKAAIGTARKDALSKTNKDVMGSVEEMVSAGNIEYYTNRAYPESIISISAGTGRIPDTNAAVNETCNTLPHDLSNYSGNPIKVHKCKSDVVGKRAALYSVFDGFRPGTVSYQYQLQKAPEQVLIMTATCPEKSCEIVSRQFDQMVQSVRIR